MRRAYLLFFTVMAAVSSVSPAEAKARPPAPKTPEKVAKLVAKKASKPQTIVLTLVLTAPCQEKHSAVASSRLMLAFAGINVTFSSRCLSMTGVAPMVETTMTFADRVARSKYYTILHRLIYKTKDKAGDVAEFFPGIPTRQMTMKKVPLDPAPAMSRKTKKRLVIVGVVVLVIAALGGAFYKFKHKLPPSVAKYLPVAVPPAAEV